MRSFRGLLGLVVILWLALPSAAHAAQPISSTEIAFTTASASTIVAQIAAGTAGKFLRFNPDATHEVSWEQPLWLHFRVRADSATAANAWTLALDKPFIDRAEFYARDPQGGWQMQAAGDWIAHKQWPQRSLNPQFYLPALSAGEHDFYLRVQNLVPLHFSAQLLATETANLQMQQTFTVAALMLGVMGLMWLISSALALVYRNAAYAWYALYVAINVVAFASYLGIGSYALWPSATWWPEESTTLCVMASMLAQLQFCRAMFLSPRLSAGLYRWVSVCMALGCVAIGIYVVVNIPTLQIILFVLVVLSSIALMVASVLRALRQHTVVVWLWLLAYAPLLMVTALTVVDTFGWYALPWLPYHTPLYALLFEMPLLLVALHLHAKTLHTMQVRKATLANIDPATGYVAPHMFSTTLETLWQQAQDLAQDMVVAYVLVHHDAADARDDYPDYPEETQRTVRALRTVAREQDTIAHIKPRLFALFMPSAALNDALAQRLARLVAVGRMADVNTPQAPTLRFRVVASSKAGFTGTWQQLDASLRRKLHNPTGWSRKSIRYLRLPGLNDSQPESDLASLSQLWDLAREESARLEAVKS
jgi:two-component system, sensor histidine kinase LadS